MKILLTDDDRKAAEKRSYIDNDLKEYINNEALFISQSMKDIKELALRFHNYPNLTVTIQGETGTGKEVIAKIIHYGNETKDAIPSIAINCATIPDSLFESELFGYEGGTFTGGITKGKKGKVDLAEGGTLFFDEIGDISAEFQVKLLRFIEEKEYYRVGGLNKHKANVRIICATNADLTEKVASGKFRKDLFYRLSPAIINLPPLRERRNEIIPLAQYFLCKYCLEIHTDEKMISDEAKTILFEYDWPGNIRELKNIMCEFCYRYDETEMKMRHIKALVKGRNEIMDINKVNLDLANNNLINLPSEPFLLDDVIDRIMITTLEKYSGNKTLAARHLGISRRSLYCRLERIEKKENRKQKAPECVNNAQ